MPVGGGGGGGGGGPPPTSGGGGGGTADGIFGVTLGGEGSGEDGDWTITEGGDAGGGETGFAFPGGNPPGPGGGGGGGGAAGACLDGDTPPGGGGGGADVGRPTDEATDWRFDDIRLGDIEGEELLLLIPLFTEWVGDNCPPSIEVLSDITVAEPCCFPPWISQSGMFLATSFFFTPFTTFFSSSRFFPRWPRFFDRKSKLYLNNTPML